MAELPQPVSVHKMAAEERSAKRNAVPMTSTQKNFVRNAKPPAAAEQAKKTAANYAREHASVVLKCKRYYKYFPETKPERKLKDSDNLQQWQLELERIREVRASADALPRAQGFFFFGVEVVNKVAGEVKPDWYIPDLVPMMMMHNAEFEPELREITIEYPGLFMHGPLLRLGIKLGVLIRGIRQGMRGPGIDPGAAHTVLNQPAIKIPRSSDSTSPPKSAHQKPRRNK